MNKVLILLAIIIMASTVYAADKGEIYFAPVLGYHFFDKDQKLDDKIEGGLRLGYFFTESIALEGEADFTRTDYDLGGRKGVTSLSLEAVKFFDFNYYYKPYVFLGAGGQFHEDNMAALVGGIGARIIATDFISFDFRVKDMFLSKGGRNDIIPSISINYHFGKTPYAYPATETKVEPVAEPVKEEPMAAPAQTEEKKEAVAMVKLDSDGDGVFNDADMCPATPAGYPVDKTGCTPDSDKDGVYDFEDKCPDTISNVKVNSAGCFIAATLDIEFKTESAVINEDYSVDIKKFAAFLNRNKVINIEIQGHTDSRGTHDFNMALSKARAQSLADILVKKYGIRKDRLSVVGYGENMPLYPNDSEANMRKNRRIETIVK